MKIKDMISLLEKYNPETEIMVLDGFNGSGAPRRINFGPISHKITTDDENESDDCEGKVDTTIALIGFGCY